MAKFLRQSFFQKSSKDQASLTVDLDDYAEPRPQNTHDEERSTEAALDKIDPEPQESPVTPTKSDVSVSPSKRSHSKKSKSDKSKTTEVEKTKSRSKLPDKSKGKAPERDKSPKSPRTKSKHGSSSSSSTRRRTNDKGKESELKV